MSEDNTDLRVLVAEVAAAYFSNSHVNASDIGQVINQIAASLSAAGVPPVEAAPADATPAAATPTAATTQPAMATPAQIRKSVQRDGIVSFEDGKAYKTLKRHLSTRGMTPLEYREKWGLPKDYPMVAPSYSEARSAMAKTIGLGARGRGAVKPAPAVKRGRGRKAAGAAAAP